LLVETMAGTVTIGSSNLMAFASCLCIASASAKAIGPVIMRGSYRLIASRLMKFCETSSDDAAVLFADGDEPTFVPTTARRGATKRRLDDAAQERVKAQKFRVL
jgi:hypothetical protein